MPTMVGAGPGQIWEPEMHSESPTWMTGTHILELSTVATQGAP